MASKEFIPGMKFHIKWGVRLIQTDETDGEIEEYIIDQVYNAVAQVKNPSWPYTRAVHVYGECLNKICPVYVEKDGTEILTVSIHHHIFTIYASKLYDGGVNE